MSTGESHLHWVEIKYVFCNYAAGVCTSERRGIQCCLLHYKGFKGRNLGLTMVCEVFCSVPSSLFSCVEEEKHMHFCSTCRVFVQDADVYPLSLNDRQHNSPWWTDGVGCKSRTRRKNCFGFFCFGCCCLWFCNLKHFIRTSTQRLHWRKLPPPPACRHSKI